MHLNCTALMARRKKPSPHFATTPEPAPPVAAAAGSPIDAAPLECTPAKTDALCPDPEPEPALVPSSQVARSVRHTSMKGLRPT